MIKNCQMVLKGVSWVHNDKIRSNGLERSQLGTQYKKNQIIWSWKESFGYTMIKLGQMVLKGVSWANNIENQVIWSWKESSRAHNDKIKSNGLVMSHFGYTVIKWCQMVLKGVNLVHNDEN